MMKNNMLCKRIKYNCFQNICLINIGAIVFGTMAAAAAEKVSTYDDLQTVLATDKNADVVFDTDGGGVQLTSASGIKISKNQTVGIQNIGTPGTAYWTETNGTTRQILNNGTLSIQNLYFKDNVIQTSEAYVGGLVYNKGQISFITDSEFTYNQELTSGKTLWGGIIVNKNKIDLLQNITFANKIAISGVSAPHGGIIENDNSGGKRSVIDVIDHVVFADNVMTGPANQTGGAIGGAIDNNECGIIDKITNSEFRNNYIYRTGTEELSGNYHASASAISNYSFIGEISNTIFEGNHTRTESASAAAAGGAIINYCSSETNAGYIGKMENVRFVNNYVEAAGGAQGGALSTAGASEDGTIKAYIGLISGIVTDNHAVATTENASAFGGAFSNDGMMEGINADFIGNYVQSKRNDSSYIGAHGGAIMNSDEIKYIIGNFVDNYATTSGGSATRGGAIRNYGKIGTISGNFISNYALSTNGLAQGGAISNDRVGQLSTVQNSNFKGNYAVSKTGTASGGAIYNTGDITFAGTNNFSDNYVKQNGVQTPNDIYNKGNIILADNAVVNIDSGISGANGNISMNCGSVLNLNGKLSNNSVTADNATIHVNQNGEFGENTVLNINEGSTLDVSVAKITVDEVRFAINSVLSLTVTDLAQDGVLYAKNLDIVPAGKATMKINIAPGLFNNIENADIRILKADNNFENTFKDEISSNNMYDFAKKPEAAGWYTVTKKTTAEDITKNSGGTVSEARAAAAWIDSEAFKDSSAVQIAELLSDLAQNDAEKLVEALSVIIPQETPTVQANATDMSDKLVMTIGNYLGGRNNGGLSSGDMLGDVTLWAKAYYGEGKFTGKHKDGFDSRNEGVIVGLDHKFGASTKIGVGIQYNDGKVDGYHRQTDVNTLTGFIYGEYRPNKWFADGIISFGVADYDEEKYTFGNQIKNNYSVDVYSLQAVSGYEFGKITPEIGTRYYRINRHGYADNIGQKVSGENMDLLRGVAGLRASYDFDIFKPEIYMGITYDFISDTDNAVISLPNGSSYAIAGKRLKRFGTELNVGVHAQISDNWSANISYGGKFLEHYQDHSGIISMKYEL